LDTAGHRVIASLGDAGEELDTAGHRVTSSLGDEGDDSDTAGHLFRAPDPGTGSDRSYA
jgi:hypothetical protein